MPKHLVVPSSMGERYVYVRTQGTSRCCDCGNLVGSVARHLTSIGALVCLECHVEYACHAYEAGWIQ